MKNGSMNLLRRAGIATGSVAILLLVLAGVLHTVFDGERIKSELARVVAEKTQRQLVISGPLELSLWPNVAVRLGRTTLSESGSATPFLAFERARLSVAVLPLLKKQVSVDGVEIENLAATLIRYKDGRLNIADLTTGAPEQKVGAGETASAPLKLDIGHIRLAHARLVWRDETSGKTTTISDLDFSTGRLLADGERKTLSVEALRLTTEGDLAGPQGNDRFTLKLEVPQLTFSPEQSRSESLALSATLAGAGRNLAAQLTLSGLKGSPEALEAAKLDFNAEGKQGATQFKARLSASLAANLAAQSFRLEPLAGRLDLASPDMPMKQLQLPLRGQARLDLKQQTAALELGTQFDESKIDARLELAKFTPLGMNFDLSIDRLDLDRYFPPQAAGSAASAGTTQANAPPPLDFSALKNLDLTGAIRIGALKVRRLELARLDARLKAAAGRLDIAPFSASLYQGTANGSLGIDANDNGVVLRQRLNNVSIAPLLKDLLGKDVLEGRGNVTLDVNGRGKTVAAMKQTLAGSAALALKDGAVKGINLAQRLREIKAGLGSKQEVTQAARSSEKTDFAELSASFRIAGGVAHNDDLMLKSPFLRVTGAGDIDLGHERLDYLAKASVVATSAGQEGKDMAQLKGITVPVRLFGPFADPAWKIELGNLVTEAAKEKIEARVSEKKQEIQQKAGDKMKDKLKGLFGK